MCYTWRKYTTRKGCAAMIKPRLMRLAEEMFTLAGNHDLSKYLVVRGRLIEFLQEEDHVILPEDEENKRWAKDLIHFIDASITYAKKTSSKEAYPYIKSFLKRMMATDLDDWDFDELRLFISSINFTESVEQAMELANQANEKSIQFKRLRLTDHLEGALLTNLCARILNAKHFNEDVTIDLADVFDSRFIWLEGLVEKNKQSQYAQYFEMIFYVMKIRRAIFNANKKEAFILCDGLTQYDEQFSEMIRSEVDFYLIEMEDFKEWR